MKNIMTTTEPSRHGGSFGEIKVELGSESISKVLNIPQSKVFSLPKWTKYGTTIANLPRPSG